MGLSPFVPWKLMLGLNPHIHAMLTFFFFALMNSCIKQLGADVPVSLELAFRFFVGMVVFYPIVRRRGGYREVLKSGDIKDQFLRTLFGAIAVAGSFYALHLMPMSNVNALGQTYPFFLLLLSVPILKEKITHHQIIACALGFLGVMVIAQPQGSAILIPMLIIMGVAFSAAASDLVVRRLARVDSNLTIMMWFFLIGGSVSLWWWILFGENVTLNGHQLLLLIGAGVCGSLAQMCMTEAFRYLGAGIMGPYSFMGFFWATICGWVLFSEVPDVTVILGALMIIGGAQISYFFSRSH